MLRTKNNSHPESVDSWEAKMTTLWQFEVRWSIFGQSPLQSNPSIPPILGLAKKRRYSENGGIGSHNKTLTWNLEMGGGIGRAAVLGGTVLWGTTVHPPHTLHNSWLWTVNTFPEEQLFFIKGSWMAMKNNCFTYNLLTKGSKLSGLNSVVWIVIVSDF